MHKLTILYTMPGDVGEFEAHYAEVHLPMVREYPGLKEVRLTRYERDPRGRPPAFYLACDLLFDDEDALNAALMSDPGRASGKDFGEMTERFGINGQFLIGTEE